LRQTVVRLREDADTLGTMGTKKLAVFLIASGSFAFSILCTRAEQAIQSVSGAEQGSVESASFPHEKPKHRSLECSKCHQVSVTKPEVREFPPHTVCVTCHNLALEGVTHPVAYCGVCHQRQKLTKADPGLLTFPKPLLKSEFGTNFSHPSHLKPVQPPLARASLDQSASSQISRCMDCHKTIEPEKPDLPDITKATGHPACFKCHGEQPAKPPSMFQCAECHKLDGPHAPQLFGLVKDFRHQDHDYDIRPKKKVDVMRERSGDRLCRECHSSVTTAASLKDIQLPVEEQCTSCHSGRVGLPDLLARDVLESLRKR
jgi:hypothetical protein